MFSSDCVELLLRNGAELSAPCRKGQTPFHKAALEGQLSCLNIMIAFTSEKDETNDSDQHSRLLLLLEMNDNWSQTALHLAAVGGHPAVIKLLLKAGARITNQNAFGQTPLHCSVIHKNFNAMVPLLHDLSGRCLAIKQGPAGQ